MNTNFRSGKWYPIETAPKCDGRYVLVYRYTGSARIHVASFRAAFEGYEFKTDNKWKRPGGAVVNNVTHWMPLPKDPQMTKPDTNMVDDSVAASVAAIAEVIGFAMATIKAFMEPRDVTLDRCRAALEGLESVRDNLMVICDGK